MGLFEFIFAGLLILKLAGVTSISYWWVFSPLIFRVSGQVLGILIVFYAERKGIK